MADVVVTISLSSVSYTTWLRTSYFGSATDDEGKPLLNNIELGTDQEDAFDNFIDESCREVLKVFSNRQGDVNGVPFEKSSTEVIYRFNEETPVLPQAASIKEMLNEDVKNAIYTNIAMMWFKDKGFDKQAGYLSERFNKLTGNIDNHLYKLHD